MRFWLTYPHVHQRIMIKLTLLRHARWRHGTQRDYTCKALKRAFTAGHREQASVRLLLLHILSHAVHCRPLLALLCQSCRCSDVDVPEAQKLLRGLQLS
jgi:hypothetical protein